MDAATTEKIVGIVKNMKVGGMPEQDISDNLRSMGVSEGELGGILEKAGFAAPAEQEPEVPELEEPEPQEDHFERLHSSVGALHEKHEDLKGGFSEFSQLRGEVEAVKAELQDIKPMVAALKRINENLIEINKKMLARLETR